MLAKSLNKPNFPGSRLHLKLMKEFDQKLTFQPIIAQTPPPQDSVPGTAAPASGPENGPGATQAPQNPMGALLLPVLMIVVMYFVLIRPQQKKMKEHQALVAGLRRGDQVVTQGGLIGKVSKVKDDAEIEVEIAEGVKVRVVRQTITQVLSKTEPAEAK